MFKLAIQVPSEDACGRASGFEAARGLAVSLFRMTTLPTSELDTCAFSISIAFLLLWAANRNGAAALLANPQGIKRLFACVVCISEEIRVSGDVDQLGHVFLWNDDGTNGLV